MSEFELKGVFPALITPFKKDESIDEEAFRALIQHVLPNVDGIVPCGIKEYGITSLKSLGIKASMPELNNALFKSWDFIFEK